MESTSLIWGPLPMFGFMLVLVAILEAKSIFSSQAFMWLSKIRDPNQCFLDTTRTTVNWSRMNAAFVSEAELRPETFRRPKQRP